jgi:small subunit ribosomal protein S16
VAVKIRLTRVGKTKQPSYRVVVTDSRAPRDGRFIEVIGSYEPRQEPSRIVVDGEKALHWLRLGAQPTERVVKLLKIDGVWATFEAEKASRPAKPARERTRPAAKAKAAPKAKAKAAPKPEVAG